MKSLYQRADLICEVELFLMGWNNTGFVGAFTPQMRKLISQLVSGSDKVLHLYSGSSKIGNVRIDIDNSNATHNITVEEFITHDDKLWEWVILDPPYAIKEIEKLKSYADARPLSGNVLLRDRLRLYFRKHVNNILWLDRCVPMVRGFKREKIWLCCPASFEAVRVLSWLKRTGPELFTLQGGITNGVGGSLKDGQPCKVIL